MKVSGRTWMLFRALLLALLCGSQFENAIAQVIYFEQAESLFIINNNNTFARAEDCRQIGNDFTFRGIVSNTSSVSDDEWFMFNGTAGACVNIDVDIFQAVGPLPPYRLNVWLFDSSQIMIAAWNTSASLSSPNFGIGSFTLPSTDTYFVSVTEASAVPNALSQPGISFTPLSLGGFAVNGAMPDSTRSAIGGPQSTGSRYDISVHVSDGNESAFDVWVDRDPVSGDLVCTPNPALIPANPGASPNVLYRGSPNLPGPSVSVFFFGCCLASVVPGGTTAITPPVTVGSTGYTVSQGSGFQPGGSLNVARSVFTLNGQVISNIDICAGAAPICIDVLAAPAQTNYIAALSDARIPPVQVSPWVPAFELDISTDLFSLTFPSNQLAPFVTGLQGTPGVHQICVSIPPGVLTAPIPIYLQGIVRSSAVGPVGGLTQMLTLSLLP